MIHLRPYLNLNLKPEAEANGRKQTKKIHIYIPVSILARDTAPT
jgi:hypothetical protein